MGYFLGCDAIIEEAQTITEATAATFSSDPLQFLPVHPSDSGDIESAASV